ncbi:MAG: fused MFS/spermidine synthase [bacterium]|nr:fused MFS/spermidine synthase [bacterium]
MGDRSKRGTIILYGLTIFLSAFLLFDVQPLIGKHILPWFGGTPAVWTACLLFFQLLLLAGYAYAHWLANLKKLPLQGLIHLSLLVSTLFLLPIIPSEAWKPGGSEDPLYRILGLLAVTVGGPYFMLATTGPLLQAWFGQIHKGKSPYRLFALSNAGSLAGLISYPFILEPMLTRKAQALVWSGSYGLFILCCGLCAWNALRGDHPLLEGEASGSSARVECEKGEAAPSLRLLAAWLLLPAAASAFLLATTNQACQNVASIPFLWVLFLSLYLVTFIIAFEGSGLYRRRWCFPLLFILVLLASRELSGRLDASLPWQTALYAGVLFAGSMVCHGELAGLKPRPRYLTLYFLMIAAGGAAGGIFVAVAAPLMFPTYWEYHLFLAAVTFLMLAIFCFKSSFLRIWPLAKRGGALLAAGFISINLSVAITNDIDDALVMKRNFYGVLKVTDFVDDNIGRVREMLHGRIVHGIAYEDPPWRGLPTAYYGEGTGVWMAVNHHPRRLDGNPLHIGVIGLGAGTMAAHAAKGDRVRFYEINGDVDRLAREWFWYEGDSRAEITTVLGDARITMEKELAGKGPQKFDLLVSDAFSGDVVPLHLLTSECAKLYRRHLKDDGILAIHISSSNFDLTPVALGLAEAIGWEAVAVRSKERLEAATWEATWILITANRRFLDQAEVREAGESLSAKEGRAIYWSDDYASLFHLVNF